MQRMADRGTVSRTMAGEYLYYIGKKSAQWRHKAAITQFHFDLLYSLGNRKDILYHSREVGYSGGRADALYIIGGNIGKKFFLEWDDGTHKFDKIAKYESYKSSGLWKREWWADPLKSGRVSFPVVLVVSDTQIPGSDIVTVRTCRPGESYLDVLTG